MSKPIAKFLPSAAKLPQTDEYVKERQASAMRLINIWSSLAERYSKPIDEDDIVDIVTGEVVKDRGVISSWDESKQGSFTREHKNHDTKGGKKASERVLKEDKKTNEAQKESNTSDEKQPGEWDDDFDELDSFATEVGSSTLRESIHVNMECAHDADNEDKHDNENEFPTTDSQDEEELKEFLGAESRRKELYGDDGDVSDEDLEIFRVQLRRFQNGWSINKKKPPLPVESEGEEFPLSSSPCPPSSSVQATSPPPSSPVRTSSPSIPPSSPSSRPSLSPQRFSSIRMSDRVTSFRHASFSSRRASSSFRASPSCGPASSSSTRAPSSSVSASSSSILTPSSLRMTAPFSRLSSPTWASPSSIGISSVDPPISSVRLSTPLCPLQSSPPRSSSCFDLFAFESESEDELGVWDLPEERKGKPMRVHPVLKRQSKTPASSPRLILKRKRVISSSEEESPRSPARSSSLTRATSNSLSPQKGLVQNRTLLLASADSQSTKESIYSKPSTMLKPTRHTISNG